MESLGRPLCDLGPFIPFGEILLQVDPALAGLWDENQEDKQSLDLLPYTLFEGRQTCLFATPLEDGSNGQGSRLTHSHWSGPVIEEEIYVHGRSVLWSGGRQLRQRFSGEGTLLQAVWCPMQGFPRPLLCMLHEAGLTACVPHGPQFVVPLLHVTSIWPLPCALLLLRERPALGPVPGGDAPLLALLHPLQEPRVPSLECAPGQGGPAKLGAPFWSSSEVPFIATLRTDPMQPDQCLMCVWHASLKPRDSGGGGCAPAGGRGSSQISNQRLSLQLRWSISIGSQQAAKGVLCHDSDGAPLLALLLPEAGQLLLLRAEGEGLRELVRLHAVGAEAVVASRPAGVGGAAEARRDLLLLLSTGELMVYVGRHPLCRVHLPLERGVAAHVVGLHSGVGERVTLVTAGANADGRAPATRCSALLLQPGLAAEALAAIGRALQGQGEQGGRVYRRIMTVVLEASSGGGESAWEALSALVRAWAKAAGAGAAAAGGAPAAAEPPPPPPDAWGFLQTCLAKGAAGAKGTRRAAVRGTKLAGEAGRKCLDQVLAALHALLEAMQLDALQSRHVPRVRALAWDVASALRLRNSLDTYARDRGDAGRGAGGGGGGVGGAAEEAPTRVPHWLLFLLRRLPSASASALPPLLLQEAAGGSLAWARTHIGLLEMAIGREAGPAQVPLRVAPGSAHTPAERVVLAMLAAGLTRPDLNRLPAGVALPLHCALDSCREKPPPDWPPAALELVGRGDLAAGRGARAAAPYSWRLQAGGVAEGGADGGGGDPAEPSPAPLHLGRDRRWSEAARLLSSSAPVAVSAAGRAEGAGGGGEREPDLVAAQQALLWKLAARQAAAPVGRGALRLGSAPVLPTEALPVPRLVLAGRLPAQHNAVVGLDAAAPGALPGLLGPWPEFHNGAAAGLRVAAQALLPRAWIAYQRPPTPSATHAGLLLALGLRGHLKALAPPDMFRYLSLEHEPTSIALLLGVAAARRGSLDAAISRMLFLHLPSRHPPTFPEVELPPPVQAAALLSIGLVYEGSAHRLTTEILLAEIGRAPAGSASGGAAAAGGDGREAHSLAAGLALGLVTLGRGGASGLADMQLQEKLQRFLAGAPPQDAGPAGGWVSGANAGSSGQNQVLEGAAGHLDVTSPGAALALGLMYLRSNSAAVAERLAVPSSHHALAAVRPDFVLLRVAARALVLWDGIEASHSWVEAQVPDILKTDRGGKRARALAADVDEEAVAQARVNVLAGACLALGLRFAGSADSRACEVLTQQTRDFYRLSKGPGAGADAASLEMCLVTAALALSVVMAGSADLGTLRLLRFLRRRRTPSGAAAPADAVPSFGGHMAVSMAMGFLFLGGGAYTFGNSNADVAVLLIALFPRFPSNAGDNRCHLQAWRHLYALAARPRLLEARDVDTHERVEVPVKMSVRTLTGGPVAERQLAVQSSTPCLLPEASQPLHVRVVDPRYWPQEALFQGGSGGRVLLVKRKAGAAGARDDPLGSRSLVAPAGVSGGSEGGARPQGQAAALVSEVTGDPSLVAFAKLLGPPDGAAKRTLLACAAAEKPGLLPALLGLESAVWILGDALRSRPLSGSSMRPYQLSALWSLKVALAFMENAPRTHLATLKQLGTGSFLATLAQQVESVLEEAECRQALRGYLAGLAHEQQAPPQGAWPVSLGVVLTWLEMPPPSIVAHAVHEVRQVMDSLGPSSANLALPLLAARLNSTPARTLGAISGVLRMASS